MTKEKSLVYTVASYVRHGAGIAAQDFYIRELLADFIVLDHQSHGHQSHDRRPRGYQPHNHQLQDRQSNLQDETDYTI